MSRLKLLFLVLAGVGVLLLATACTPSSLPPTTLSPKPTASLEGLPEAGQQATNTPPPSPIPSPSPTPVPPLTWQNPWHGGTISVPARCWTPEIQQIVKWAQTHPKAFAEAVKNYEAERIAARDGQVVMFLHTHEFDQPALSGRVDEETGQVDLLVHLPALLLGLAQRYDYPELGMTVFTACALIYDNDLAQRPGSAAEITSYPQEDKDTYALLRPDPENADPHWYLGEVAVAYVVVPQGPMAQWPAVTGTRQLQALSFVSLSSEGGASGLRKTTPYEARFAPGCYYPYQPLGISAKAFAEADEETKQAMLAQTYVDEDPQCERLEDILSRYNTWLGTTALTLVPFWEKVNKVSHWRFAFLDDLNYDFYVEPLTGDSAEVEAEAEGWLHAYFSPLNKSNYEQEGALVESPTAWSYDAAAFALPHVLVSWKDGAAGGQKACTAMRALAQYKLDEAKVSVPCPLDMAAQRDFWTPLKINLLDGDLSTGMEIALEDLTTLIEAEAAPQATATLTAMTTPAAEPTEQNNVGANASDWRYPICDPRIQQYKYEETRFLQSLLLPQQKVVFWRVIVEYQAEPKIVHRIERKFPPVGNIADEYYLTPSFVWNAYGDGPWSIDKMDEDTQEVLIPACYQQLPVPTDIQREMMPRGEQITYEGSPAWHYTWRTDDVPNEAKFIEETIQFIFLFSDSEIEFTPQEADVEVVTTLEGVIRFVAVHAKGELTFEGRVGPGEVGWEERLSDFNALSLQIPSHLQKMIAEWWLKQAPLSLPEGTRFVGKEEGMMVFEVRDPDVEHLIQFWKDTEDITVLTRQGNTQTGLTLLIKDGGDNIHTILLTVSEGKLRVAFAP